jgi:hypothetical protein
MNNESPEPMKSFKKLMFSIRKLRYLNTTKSAVLKTNPTMSQGFFLMEELILRAKMKLIIIENIKTIVLLTPPQAKKMILKNNKSPFRYFFGEI